MKRILVIIGLVFLVFFQTNMYAQDYSKFKPIAINGYYFKNILPFTESNQVGFGVVIPAYINNDSLIDFYSTKTKYPQNGNSVYEVSTFEIFINQGNFIFKKDTKQYIRDSIFIIRDDGISAISDFNGDGVNDLVITGEPFHYNPQSAYYNIGMRDKIDVDSSKGYARRPNVLISNNGKLIDSLGYLDTLLLKSYFGAITFDWNNDGKNDLVLAERGEGKTFQFWENKGNKMSVSYPILERDSLQVSEGPFNLAAYDLNNDGFKDFIFSSQVESYISQNGNVYVCFNEKGKFNNTSVVNIINHRNLPVEKNGLRVSDIQVNDLDNDGNPEIISLFSNGSGDHSAIDNNKIKSIFKITTYKDANFIDVTNNYFPTKLNENLFYSNRQFKLIDLDNDGLLDIYPITGDNGCTTKYPQGCGYFGYQGIDSTIYFKNKKGSFELKSLGLFFSDTVSQNVYNEFKQRKINIGGYNLALGNQIVPYFFKGISKPVFVAGIQKGGVEMYEGEIYNDSLKNLRTRVIQNSFLNYNFRPGFVMVPCDVTKPIFNTSKFTFCSGDSLKLSITNVNKGDLFKWSYGNNSDLTNSSTNNFKDSTKLFVIKTDSLGCVISSDTISITKNVLPVQPTVNDTVFCQNISSSKLLAKETDGNTLNWYGVNATGGTGSTTALFASTTDTTIKSYYVSQINNATNCESARAKIIVKINPAPAIPSVKDTSFCNNINADTLKATSLTGHTLNWYGTSVIGGAASLLGSKPTTSTTGSFSYYVSQKNNSTGCEGARAKIGVTINPLPSTPIVRDTNYCNNASSDTIRVIPSTGATLLWYGTSATGGTGGSNAIKPSTANVGSVNYYISQIITNTGCEGARAKINVTINAIPIAPTLSRDTASYLVSNIVVGNTWYKDGTLLTDSTQKIKPTTPGSYSAKTTTNGCTSVMSAAYYYLVTDIINLSKDEFIKLAPNPFINQLNFDFVVKGYQKLNIEVYDVATGTKVASQPNLNAGSRINLGQLSAGTYVIKITSTDNKISYQFKMVKL